MAGGYKLFSTGEVLTAANVNNYLMKQTVMVFASAAARTTALSGVLAEGMISYRTDSHVLEVYNGTVWEAPDTQLTTKGDLAVFSTVPDRLGVGSNTQVLTADSTTATGLKWATPNAGTVTSIVASTGITGGTITSTGTIAIDTAVVTTLTGTQTLTNKTLTAPIMTYSVNAQTGTTFTPALSDAASIVTLFNASAIAVTIPTNASVAYAVGTQLNFIQTGSGQPTISGASGVTVSSTGATSTSPKIRVINGMATAIQTAANVWYVVGDIA